MEPWHILVAAFIAGVGQAFDQPSRASIFPRLVDREHIVNAVAMESVVWNGVRVLAPALAGMVIARLSIETSMLISAASFYVLAAVMSILRLRDRPPARGGVMQQIGEAFRYIHRNPIFLYVMLMTFCNSLFGISYILLMPSLAEKWLMVGAERVGWLLGAAGAGAIVGNWIIGSIPSHSPRGLIILFGAMLYGSLPVPVLRRGLAGSLLDIHGHPLCWRHQFLAVPGGRPQRPAGSGAGQHPRAGDGPVRRHVEPGPAWAWPRPAS